jgi:Holliday junction resolvasome RuvABC endonuclease subunit
MSTFDVIGVDPSLTCTGVAHVDEGGAVSVMRIPTAGDGSLDDIRLRVRLIVGSVLRFAPTSGLLSVIEAPYIPQHGSGQVLERAWLFGMLVDQLALRGQVAQVRAKTRAKYGSGNGNAAKPEVRAAVRAAFPGLRIRDDNEADALALAAMGARHLGSPIDGLPSKAQSAAMLAVAWPTPTKGMH